MVLPYVLRLAIACVLVACGGGGPRLLVDVRTDLVPAVELGEVSVDLLGDGLGDPDLGQTRLVLPSDDFLDGVRIAEFDGIRNGERRLRAQLFGVDGSSLGDRDVQVQVRGNTAVTIVFTRSCVGIECPGDGSPTATECLNGTCVPPDCVGGMCPEACVDVSDCPRGAACSEPMCLDGACFLAPTGEACASGFVCIPERGCEPTGSMDGGTGCVDGMPCNTGNECERGRTDCSSGSAVCVADGVMDAGVSCRPADNECDIEEFCDGVAPTCPTDGFAEVGTPCTGGFCNGPACGACQPGVACETPNACETGTIECADGVPTCVASGVVAAGTECREAAGPCDVAELCDGTSPECPGDAFQPIDFVCRAAAGTCDQVEVCDGATPACPADTFDMSTECRPAVGPCDLAEVCSGGASCPPDDLRAAGSTCRAAATECDAEETCDGATSVCPDDEFESAGTMCSGGRVCDGSGACLDLGCGDPCSTGAACEIGIIDCSTGSPVCVRDRLRDIGFVCRPVAGACDVAEECDGVSAACPVDGFLSGGECRAASGACDLAESCTGTSAFCPTDQVRPASFECRASAGMCDIAENCDGTNKACPSDVFVSSATVCRGSEGICDVIENCPGNGPDCPADGFVSSGVVCRPGIGMCDRTESCTGTAARCPADQLQPAGFPCSARDEFPCHVSECDGSGMCEIVGDNCPGGQACCELGCNICP